MPKVTRQVVKPKASSNGKDSSVLDRIMPASEYVDHGCKIVVYGRGGSGKTTLISTFPKPLLHVVCSGTGEVRSIKNVKGIDTVTLNDADELKEISDGAADRYATIALDHITGYRDLVLKKVLGVDDLPPQLSWGTASQEQWGQVTAGVKEHVNNLLKLPNTVVIAAQERVFDNDEKSSDLLDPYVNCDLNPGIVGWLNYQVDYLVQTFIRPKIIVKETKIKAGGKEKTIKTNMVSNTEFEYCLRTGIHSVCMTKFRVPRGVEKPSVIIDPSWDKIEKIING